MYQVGDYMPSIFDLESISTSINDALRANREGNAARRAESLKNAFALLQGAQTAAQTRETMQRTTQSAKLFPSALTTAKEGAKQAGQETTQSELRFPHDLKTAKEGAEQAEIETQKQQMNLDEMINLRKFFKDTYGLDVPPEKILSGMKAETEREALDIAREGGLAQATGEGILAEEKARKPVATAISKKADIDILASRYRKFFRIDKISSETLAETIPQEFALKLDTLEARKAETMASLEKTKLGAAELQYEQDKLKLLDEAFEAKGLSPAERALWEYAIKNGFSPDAAQYNTQIGTLTMALARVKASPSIKAAIEEAAAAEATLGDKGAVPRAQGILEKMKMSWGGATERPFATEEDKEDAVELLTNQINALKEARDRLPLAPPMNLTETIPSVFTPEQLRQNAQQLRKARGK